MQYLDRLLQSLAIRENYSSSSSNTSSDQHALNAQNLHTYLAKILYKRRSDFNPLWNQVLVAGFDEAGSPFLSLADLLGTTYSGEALATGFGAHLALPLLRRLVDEEEKKRQEKKEDGDGDGDGVGLTRESAVAAIRECMKVLFYRDARSSDRYSLAVVTREGGVEVCEDEVLEAQSWAFADGIRGYGTQVN
jgi:20S proteasome subunit beta 7